ncbi:hypothetical protein ACIQU4_25835 [Streptomyces sp. NPDC090741]|uniref:hypothetical protein n=1 Tax=Streptomyces sp. NPDC090741 TaxID=3365967 RepID=UPI00381B5CD0
MTYVEAVQALADAEFGAHLDCWHEEAPTAATATAAAWAAEQCEAARVAARADQPAPAGSTLDKQPDPREGDDAVRSEL